MYSYAIADERKFRGVGDDPQQLIPLPAVRLEPRLRLLDPLTGAAVQLTAVGFGEIHDRGDLAVAVIERLPEARTPHARPG